MPPPSVCRICVSKCLNFKKLYKQNGHSSYENDLAQKYLNGTIVNMEIAKHLTVMCSQCWRQILDFHNFQQCVILAQKKLAAEIDVVKTTTVLVEKQEINNRSNDNISTTVEAEAILEENPITVLEVNLEPALEENSAEIIESENEIISEPLTTQNNALNINDTNSLNGDSDDSLADFLGFDVKMENQQDLIDVHSSDSSHSSDIQMVVTSNTENAQTIKTPQSNTNDVEATQSHNPTTSNSNISYRKDLNSYQRISNKELDALVYEFMPNINCRHCNEAFASFTLIRSHYRKQHPKLEFFIKCCNVKLKNRGCVEGHFRNHKSPRFFKCDYCDKSYSLKKYLNVHVMQCHPEIRHARTHKCPKCQEAFALQYFMKLHLKTCNGDSAATSTSSNDQPPTQTAGTSGQFYQGEVGDYVCNICEKVCTNIVALRKHTWYHHRAEPKRKCNFCEETFRQNVEWREHIAFQHTGEHLYSCPNCPKTFLRRSWLLVHQKELHGIKSARSCCTPPRRCAMHSQAEASNTNANSE